jgi:hypothetical protein
LKPLTAQDGFSRNLSAPNETSLEVRSKDILGLEYHVTF